MSAVLSARADDDHFMQLALTLGRRGLGNSWPNPAVGAVVVKDAIVIGRGWTQAGGRPHAETEALKRAGTAAKGATLYVTLEPCSHHGKTPPCADAIVAAGIARVVSALDDPNPEVAGAGHKKLRAAGIIVDIGVGAEEARRAHAGHIRRLHDKRPHVTLKLAISADGKAGLAGRRPFQITGEIARERVHLLRAMNDAILVGIGTILADDPVLTVRLPGLQPHSPIRVVLDSALKLPVASAMVKGAGQIPVWAIAGQDAPAGNERALRAAGVEVIRLAKGEGGLDLAAVLRTLADKGITRLMVEGGPKVAASFLKADVVDEACLLRAPKEIGRDGIDALEGLSLDALTASPRLKRTGGEALGADSIEFFERV